MIPATKHREVIFNGVTDSKAFGISLKDTSHIKSILRDTLYSDKILAVLREYSANAWDAHRMAGKGELPIKVVLPSWDSPSLIIQDFGPGLSHEEVFEVFTQYGASTKRDGNEAVGMLGIGSKSGFAYSDTFTIISRHGGVARTYVAVLDENDNDTMNLLAEEPCGEDTGLTIQIATRPNDIYEFQTKARGLFQHYEPRPDINLDLPKAPEIRARLTHGVIFNKTMESWEGSGWVAVMGCVPYRINLDQLKNLDGTGAITENLKRCSGVLRFDIGAVQINASREELKYSDITKKALIQKFSDLLDEFVTVTLQDLETSGLPSWDKRLRAQVLISLGLGTKEGGELVTEAVSIPDDQVSKSFLIYHAHGTGQSIAHSISVKAETRLIRKTFIGKKNYTGFNLGHYNYLIVPRPQDDGSLPGWHTINADLDAMITKLELTGIPVTDLHMLPWQPKNPNRAAGTVNAKHTVSTFRLTGKETGIKKMSQNWEIVNRVPTVDDVFVIINGFETLGYSIYNDRAEDETLAHSFGLTLPEIYGYKNTSAKPVLAANMTGIHYPEWRKKFFASLPQDQLAAMQEARIRASMITNYYSPRNLTAARVEEVANVLGEAHPIVVLLQKALAACITDRNSKLDYLLERLNLFPTADGLARQEQKALHKMYPLFSSYPLNDLWGMNSRLWLHYVQVLDTAPCSVPLEFVNSDTNTEED